MNLKQNSESNKNSGLNNIIEAGNIYVTVKYIVKYQIEYQNKID